MTFYSLLKKCNINEKYYRNFRVKGITDNSKKVKPGFIFFSMNNNCTYVEEAISRGAEAIIIQEICYDDFSNIVKVENIKIIASIMLFHYNRKYLKDIDITGVTGTNGKTTTSYILYRYLNHINEKTMFIGTLGVQYENIEIKGRNTTPSIFDIYHYIKIAFERNIKNIVMEVSSHGLKELRVKGLTFKNVIITNITSDHLDYHHNQTDYLYSKCRIFDNTTLTSVVVLNKDDEYYQICSEMVRGKAVTYGKNKTSDYYFQFMNIENNITTFNVNGKYYKTSLLGEFNIYNIASIIALLSTYNYDLDSFYQFLQEFTFVKGRMNVLNHHGVNYIIDFAHTSSAVGNVLSTLKNYDLNKLYVVIGCGGNRDKTKRNEMAKVCTSIADRVILTSDNPRDEDPVQIIRDMTKDISLNNYEVIVDRRLAIKKVTELARSGDYVAILGKGHEEYQEINGSFIEFNDQKVLREILKN